MQISRYQAIGPCTLAKAIEKAKDDDVSLKCPPLDLYVEWVGDGPVTHDTRRSEQYKERKEAEAERKEAEAFASEGKDIFAQYNQMIENKLKMNIARSMKGLSNEHSSSNQQPPQYDPPANYYRQWQQPSP